LVSKVQKMNNKQLELLVASISTGILAYMLATLFGGSLITLVISIVLGLTVRTKFFAVGVASLALWMILFKLIGVIMSFLLIACIIGSLVYFDFFNKRKV